MRPRSSTYAGAARALTRTCIPARLACTRLSPDICRRNPWNGWTTTIWFCLLRRGVEIPLYLEQAILKGLAVQPEDRFQTAADFLEAIENPTAAEPAGSGPELSEEAAPPRKKKAYYLFAGGAAAVLAAAAAVVLMMGGPGEKPAAGTAVSQEQQGAGGLPGTPAGETVTIGGKDYSTSLTAWICASRAWGTRIFRAWKR